MTRWLRLKLSTADTPYEQAKTIGLAVPKRRDEIDQLADLYVRERYGRAEVDPNQTRSIWQRIHWSLWSAGIKRRLPRGLSAPRALLAAPQTLKPHMKIATGFRNSANPVSFAC